MERTTSFGYWMRRRRKALDLTQDELAHQVGCAVGTIKKLEGDERRPSKQLADRLADMLKLPPEERPAFLKAARAELATDQLDIAAQPVETLVTAPVPAEPLPTGTVTFLFTDIEDSTRLWSERPEAMRTALAHHDAILRHAIEAHGGLVIKTVGDAFHAVFATAADAFNAALAAQRGLQAESWDELASVDRPQSKISVRMAIHTGTADLRDGDYFGHALNRAARILSAGHGGQVLLSAATWELLRDHLPPDVTLRDLGTHWLKGLPRPEQIYQLVAPDLSIEFPPLVTLDRPTTNLPPQATAFIGREREVAAIEDLLRRDDVRLVTLTGPGGTGKTRLALQVAADLFVSDSPPLLPQRERGSGGEGLFPGGTWFVNLAPISDLNLVASTIAQALGVREAGGQPILDSLKSYLRAKHLLLLLDNFEQIADAAPTVAELLAAAPGLKVLVTSRMPLRLSGEREFAVPPLGLPPAFERSNVPTLTQYEAVRLFIERAQAVKADFAVTNENAPAVAEICYRLDGLPLAIELAAARVKLFPLQALLVRLDQRLKFLTGGARDLPARQQTIRNTINWSYDLLEDGEKTLFARLGVFVGGCTIEAAEAVCNADGDPPMEVVDGIAALVDKSLVRPVEGSGDEPRFTMLETIREYALERLEASGEAEIMRRYHAAYYLALAETAEPKLYSPELLLWLDRLEQEHDNLRAALRWTIERHKMDLAIRLGAALGWFWFVRGYEREGLQWLEAALTQSSANQTPARAWALLHAGGLAGDISDRGREYKEGSLALFRMLGDKRGTARTLFSLGQGINVQGNNERAEAMLTEQVMIGQELGDVASLADAMASMIKLAELRGDNGALIGLAAEHVALRRQIGDPQSLCWSLNVLGEVARLVGDDRAIAAYEEALALARELRNRGFVAAILSNLGFIMQRQGNHARAAMLFNDRSYAVAETRFDPLRPVDHDLLRRDAA